MVKRGNENSQLRKEDYDRVNSQSQAEPTGSFQKASEEQLKRRRILRTSKAKFTPTPKAPPAATAGANAFGGVRLASSATKPPPSTNSTSASSNPFSGLKMKPTTSPSVAPPFANLQNLKPASLSSQNKAPSLGAEKRVHNLNQAVAKAIDNTTQQDPACDMSGIMGRYLDYYHAITDVQLKPGSKESASNPVTAQAPAPPPAAAPATNPPAFSFGSAPPATSKTPAFSFGGAATTPAPATTATTPKFSFNSAPSSSPATASTPGTGTFSFGATPAPATASTPGTGTFSFGAPKPATTSTTGTFSFGAPTPAAVSQPPADSKEEETVGIDEQIKPAKNTNSEFEERFETTPAVYYRILVKKNGEGKPVQDADGKPEMENRKHDAKGGVRLEQHSKNKTYVITFRDPMGKVLVTGSISKDTEFKVNKTKNKKGKEVSTVRFFTILLTGNEKEEDKGKQKPELVTVRVSENKFPELVKHLKAAAQDS